MSGPDCSNLPIERRVTEIIAHFSACGLQLRGAADDSRQVRPGDLFIAYPGDHADGRHYIADAIARGAAAVLWHAGDGFAWDERWSVANLGDDGLRSLCGPLAHKLFGQPSERLSLVAITGTNGKTTISQWLGKTHPRPCAIIGTLGAGRAGELQETGFTTPEAATLTRYLSEFSAAGVQACALEASSIGIEEGRLDGARVDVAVFTNLTRDHLDYHGSMVAYAAAKQRLFTWPRLRLAVINLDDPFSADLLASTTASKVMGYSMGTQAMRLQGEVRADSVEETIHGLRFRLCTAKGRALVETDLLGRYNLSNLLAVAAVLLDAGLTPREIAERFSTLGAPPGRLERIGGYNEPLIVVDYAHTPDALQSALEALRGVATARGAGLSVVFGCGGDRDRGKRPLMGRIAVELADRVVLTSDNPRSEDPSAILDEIRVAAQGADVIADRGEAIRRTILSAQPAEVVLIAGKGHEPYQEVAGVRRPFSDVAEARAALAARTESES